MLDAFLDNFRADLLDRAWGLDHHQLQIVHPPSTLTLSRLIGHMALVEHIWFQDRFDGEGYPAWADALDHDADPDAEMTEAQALSVDDLLARFSGAVEDSRRRAAAARSLDQLSKMPNRDGEHWNLRWIMIHMVEEYARHCGHADLIREAIDGDTAS